MIINVRFSRPKNGGKNGYMELIRYVQNVNLNLLSFLLKENELGKLVSSSEEFSMYSYVSLRKFAIIRRSNHRLRCLLSRASARLARFKML